MQDHACAERCPQGFDANGQSMHKINILKKRPSFLAAAKGRRWGTRNLLVQVKKRPLDRPGPARFGITITKKVGNAVLRNRIRRRLKHALHQLGDAGMDGHDYVLIARSGAVTASFSQLCADVIRATQLTETQRATKTR